MALTAYRQFLGQRSIKYLLITNLIGRSSNGMAPLGLAVHLRAQGNSFGAVGALCALYGVCMAVGGPPLGRAVDRYGMTRVLLLSAALSSSGFLWLALSDGVSPISGTAAVILVGLTSPPLESALRSLWSSVVTGAGLLGTAYALDSSAQQVLFICGPLLVVAVAGTWSSAAVLVVIAVTVLGGTAAFVAPRATRTWRPEARSEVGSWSAAVRSSLMRRLLIGFVLVGMSLGSITIGMVGFQESVGHAGLAGIMLGVQSFGALIGGVFYGSRPRELVERRGFLFQVGAMALCLLPAAFLVPPPLMALLLFCDGLLLSPLLANVFLVVGTIALPGTRTEVFAWVITAILSGHAAGSALTGIVQDRWGLGPALGVAAIGCGLAFPVIRSANWQEYKEAVACTVD